MVAVWKQLVQTEKDSCSPLLGRFICHTLRPKVNTIVHPTSYPTHIPFVPSESTLPFLRYSNFNILPWKSKVKVMAEVKIWSHNVSITSYWLASLSFHVNGPSHSWDTAFSKFDLENPRSMSYLKAKKIVGTTPYQLISLSFEVHEPSHSYLLLLKNLTLKIQGQGHGWGEHWKSHHGSNILLTHIPFVPSQSAIPFLRYSIFRIWPWKSKVKVMGERNVESHNMGPTLYRLTSLSFHVNRPCHSWDTAFSKFDLENPRPRSKVRWMLKTTTCVQHYSQSAIPFLRYDFFQIWPWKSKVKVMVEVQVESHKVGVTSYRFTSLPCQSALPFLR